MSRRHESLTPGMGESIARAVRKLAPAAAGATRPHGVADLGDGDTVWTDPDTGDQHSVRDEAALAAVTRELVRVDGERLSTVIEDAQALLTEVAALDDTLTTAQSQITGAVTAAGSALTRANEAWALAETAEGVARYGTITAERLLVGPGNLFPDPYFKADKWAGSGVSRVDDPDVPGGTGLRIVSAAAQRGAYYGGRGNHVLQVIPGVAYRVRATVKVEGTAAQHLNFYFHYKTAAGTNSTRSARLVEGSAAEGVAVYEAEIVAPAVIPSGMVTMGLFTSAPHAEGRTFTVSAVTVSPKVGAIDISNGAVAAPHVDAYSIAAAVANLLQINTEQLVVTEDAYLGRALAEQIAASLAAFELLVITAAQLDPSVGAALDLAGNPAVDGLDADLTGLEQRVTGTENSLTTVRNAVVIEPTGITVTDGQVDQNAVTISNSRVGFVAAGYEVAWIDGQKQVMAIQDVEVFGGTTVGRHRIETWSDETTVVRWIGGV